MAGCKCPQDDKTITKAVCVLQGEVTGKITFEKKSSAMKISGEIQKLPQGLHGFHIHEFGDLSNGCISCGPHFNPLNKSHGDKEGEERHLGDLGNIKSENGTAKINLSDNFLTFRGTNSILGRSLVVHEKEDDLGKGEGESKTNGNSGKRVGCGIIGVSSK